MKSAGINFKLFGIVFNLRISAYRSSHHAPLFHYGSTSNFGKWKTTPTGDKTRRKRK